MLNVLHSWEEIGEANKFLKRNNLPAHSSPEKNWDLYQVYKVLNNMPREKNIVDLGCGELYTLKFLYAMDFINLYGIDFSLTWKSRLSQIRMMWRARSLRVPFHLYKRDILATGFPDQFFDIAICISVIEHGVDLEKFLAETHRILKPDGLVFITTDYWEEELKLKDNCKPFGLPWKIFSKKDVELLIRLSYHAGFSLYKDSSIPGCFERCVIWNKQEYTFISIVLKKTIK